MPRSRPDGNKFLDRVEVLLNQAMGGFPHGTLALKDICEQHKGEVVYVPGATEIYIEWRNRQIRNEFKGDNVEELAARWNLQLRQIRNILKKS